MWRDNIWRKHGFASHVMVRWFDSVGAASMKTLNETFTDEEYESMLHVKKESGLNWHDFILTSCLAHREQEQ